MKRMIFIGIVFLLLVPIAVFGREKSQLVQDMEKNYLTHAGIDRVRITQPGAVFTLQIDGIMADLASDMTFSPNTVDLSGDRVAVRQAHGFGASLASSGFIENKEGNRTLKKGDKVYVIKIEDSGADTLKMQIITCDTYDVSVHGSTKQMRYKAQLVMKLGEPLSGLTGYRRKEDCAGARL